MSESSSSYLYIPIHTIFVVGLALSSACLAIRLHSRYRTTNRLDNGELCLLSSWTLCLTTQILILYALDYAGLGFHLNSLDASTINRYKKLLLIVSCLFVLGIYLARLSQLLLLHHLVRLLEVQWLRKAILVITVFTTLGSFILVCCFVFACRPISKSWNIVEQGDCISQVATYISVAVFNITTDMTLVVLFGVLLWNLPLSKPDQKKFSILSLLACITIIASAARLRLTVPLLSSEDLTYAMTPIALLVGTEMNLIIFVVCLPAVWKFLCTLTMNHESPSSFIS
ncbi:uncharacterized protein BP01DRAFT_361099 [Aspergillus saccharolyticus JOP 1030-1]|uniref:Rhodopsin domain-containing protein n=1 Tax=Aspergillus saccharolyticus JOP 1030-1 TaxID=1450539 RepID=A0A318Z026_9EURO|nr:hypothetical protein BP01DRAFT_361099 [Aspergillus saccharolyticus JOP 1030-1]PYH40595.1 hypothetical protein BP01DRAFT_361099 [Aspergillus saccharolyticus JOP 1030-1]